MCEILLRQSGVSRSWSYFLAVNCIVAFSAIYEILEAIAAMVVSPELGSAYLGTQGDEWDAQKDAFLAFIGAIVGMLATWQCNRSRTRTSN
jgi:putative membrane protein